MPVDLLIARWVALFWIVMGLSHAMHPAAWASLLMPLRERPTGGLILAACGFPVALVIILGHNRWEWSLSLIVTVGGWLALLKSIAYLLLPTFHRRVMSLAASPEAGFRGVGLFMVVLGAVTAYDAFWVR